MRHVKCLDKGFVDLIYSAGNDTTISNAARIIREDWRGDKDEKLLSYLLKHRHTSPFEHVVFSFHIKAPIFVFRQWHRHRTWSFNEFSGRYKKLPDEYYVPELGKIGVQSTLNLQGRKFNNEDKQEYLDKYIAGCNASIAIYNELLNNNWPRELARCVLPLSMYSEMFATVDLWNLLHFISLRSDDHAQYEIQVYSNAIKDIVKEIVPVTMSIWDKFYTNQE